MWRGSECWVWGSPVLRGGKHAETGVSVGQGVAVGVSRKGAWGMGSGWGNAVLCFWAWKALGWVGDLSESC